MTNPQWRPLHAREAGEPVISQTSDSASVSLEMALRSWIYEALDDEDAKRIAVRLDIPDALDHTSALYDEPTPYEMYEIIDAILYLQPSVADYFVTERQSLQHLLDDSHSVYTIRLDGRGLENRADSTATAALADSITNANARVDAGSAGDHLATAWAHAFAIHPDPVKAYSESIKAVEAAAHAIIEPNNAKATMGTMLGHMRSHPTDFLLMLPSPGVTIDAVIGMMAALWAGQTSRHASQNPTRPETVEEARAAVHIAVALVEWFGAGIVRRSP